MNSMFWGNFRQLLGESYKNSAMSEKSFNWVWSLSGDKKKLGKVTKVQSKKFENKKIMTAFLLVLKKFCQNARDLMD